MESILEVREGMNQEDILNFIGRTTQPYVSIEIERDNPLLGWVKHNFDFEDL
jgi:hypothetical protein